MENIIAQRIKKEREKKGWTQAHLAVLIGFPDSSYVSKIENGKRNVTPEEAVLLAGLFNCSIHYLLDREPQSDIKTEINDPERISGESDVERLLDDAKEALSIAVKEGHK